MLNFPEEFRLLIFIVKKIMEDNKVLFKLNEIVKIIAFKI